MKKIGLYPGCCFQGSDIQNYKIVKEFLDNMDIEEVLLKKSACCGGSVLDETNKLLVYSLNARNIALAEKEGVDLYTPCNTCYMIIAKSKIALDENKKLKDDINKILTDEGLEYKGVAKIYHTLNLIRDFIGINEYKSKLKNKLHNLKVAPYYGCHIVSPTVTALDNPDNPTILEEILEPLGVEVIKNYENKDTCCGYHASYTNLLIKENLSNKPISGAIKANADLLVTPCPLCHKAMEGSKIKVVQIAEMINKAC